jgi:hypothetical protein
MSEGMQKRIDAMGIWGALLLGVLFAVAFCPTSAVWFFGLLALNLLNFVRIVGLYFIGGLYYDEFHRAHVIYFPIFLIAMTVGVWIVWVRWVTRDDYDSQPAGA